MSKLLSLDDFIARARATHGDKYDYSHVVYTRACHKVAIVCPVHGEFNQIATSHIQGDGCPLCWRERFNSSEIRRGRKPLKGIIEKKCPKCGNIFPRTIIYFSKNKYVSDGLSIYCKECIQLISRENARKYRNKNKAKRNEENRKRIDSGYFRVYY